MLPNSACTNLIGVSLPLLYPVSFVYGYGLCELLFVAGEYATNSSSDNNNKITERTRVPRRPYIARKANYYFEQEQHQPPTESNQDATERLDISSRFSTPSSTQQVIIFRCASISKIHIVSE